MSETDISLDMLQELISRGPFNHWLGFKFVSADETGIELTATWREEWVVNPERRYTHGGILAAIVDVAPTIDMRVDYHKAAMPGDLTAKAKILRLGGQFSSAEALVYDKDGALVASGRGTYFTPKPK